MRIAFIALWSPTNAKYWSGTPHHSYHAIREAHPDTVLIDTPILDAVLFHAGKVSRRLGLDLLREPSILGLYRYRVSRLLARAAPDVVVSVGASHKLCDLPETVPVVHAADALFATIVGYYQGMSGLSERSRKRGDAVQRRFLEKVASLCLTSRWAMDSAEHHYPLDHCRKKVVPLGANVHVGDAPTSGAERRKAVAAPSFLFIGGDWVRKGGPLLLDAFARLRRRYPEATLHIVGCRPPLHGPGDGITVHGHLDKSDPADAARLDALFRSASFLFVPSRQEAFGLVYCEACAHGLPSIATATGGVPSILTDGRDSLLFAPEAAAEDFAAGINALWRDEARYLRMCAAARETFLNRLSWSAWANAIREEAEALVQARNVAGDRKTAGRRVPREEPQALAVDASSPTG
ncbi:glycosyltransferase family 4 protein [Roseivivax marinus]|uniref:glycosyltransferase family 4 protein n=1 Tax=Roseivivax marinus TaxID=1379903 RepID=UPI00273FB355|nr:glycosyltransferase family 4 protein [Roseivivax marinus]